MNTLESIITASFSKIFSFYGYAFKNNDNYILYRVPDSVDAFYLFQEPDKDYTSLFSVEHFQCISKAELFIYLSKKDNLREILNIVPQVNAHLVSKEAPLITKKITTDILVNMILSLAMLDNEAGTWHSTPQFQKRVFKSGGNFTYRVPLCLYNDRKFERFVNLVEWNEDETRFINTRSEGFWTTNFLPSNTKMFVTSNPLAWQKKSLAAQAPEYLFILSHPDGSFPIHQAILHLFKKNAFSHLLLLLHNHNADFKFTLSLLSFFLNYENSKCHFTFNVIQNRFQLTVDFNTDQRIVSSLTSLISEVDLDFSTLFFSGLKNEYIISGNTLANHKLQVKRIGKDKHSIYFISFYFTTEKAKIFLAALCSQFLTDTKIEFEIF